MITKNKRTDTMYQSYYQLVAGLQCFDTTEHFNISTEHHYFNCYIFYILNSMLVH